MGFKLRVPRSTVPSSSACKRLVDGLGVCQSLMDPVVLPAREERELRKRRRVEVVEVDEAVSWRERSAVLRWRFLVEQIPVAALVMDPAAFRIGQRARSC